MSLKMPALVLRRRLAALERQMPAPQPKSEFSELLAYMTLGEMEALHAISMRSRRDGMIPAADRPAFESICLAARERQARGERQRG